MSRLKKFFGWRHYSPALLDDQTRKYRLLHTITFQLFIFGSIFTCVNFYMQIWNVAYLLLFGSLITLINLVLLRKKVDLIICSHIINFLCVVIMTLGNFWVGGSATSYMGWFYVSPVIAAVTIGISGLIIYSLLSVSIVGMFSIYPIKPLYVLSEDYLRFLDDANHLFIFILIFTTLYNLLKVNHRYETLLKEQNYLLLSDKKKFHYLSQHDSLTNLPNRAYFHNHLQKLMDTLDKTKNTITLYYMDLDGFKKINDLYGHEAGDLILLQTTKRLKSCFRDVDFIARLGGDEFTALIVHGAKDKTPDHLTTRLNKEFSKPFMINKIEISCTISIGQANYPHDTQNMDTLIKLADEAMYENKKTKYSKNEQNHE